MAKSHKCDERCRPSSQRPQYPTLCRRLKRRLGRSLRSKFYKGSVVRRGKKATHKGARVEGGLPGPSKLQGPVPEPNRASCNGQLNGGSLHKQTRRNSLSRDVCSPVEDHDMVSLLSHNVKSQIHSRVSVMADLLSMSNQVQSTVRVSSPRPKCLGHRCSELKLDGSHCLCLPCNGSLSQGDPKIRQCHCLIIVIAPGWPGMPWFWDLVQLSTEIPLQLPVSTTLLKQSHNYVFHNNLQHLNLHAWCLGVDSSKNKASLWR